MKICTDGNPSEIYDGIITHGVPVLFSRCPSLRVCRRNGTGEQLLHEIHLLGPEDPEQKMLKKM